MFLPDGDYLQTLPTSNGDVKLGGFGLSWLFSTSEVCLVGSSRSQHGQSGQGTLATIWMPPTLVLSLTYTELGHTQVHENDLPRAVSSSMHVP